MSSRRRQALAIAAFLALAGALPVGATPISTPRIEATAAFPLISVLSVGGRGEGGASSGAVPSRRIDELEASTSRATVIHTVGASGPVPMRIDVLGRLEPAGPADHLLVVQVLSFRAIGDLDAIFEISVAYDLAPGIALQWKATTDPALVPELILAGPEGARGKLRVSLPFSFESGVSYAFQIGLAVNAFQEPPGGFTGKGLISGFAQLRWVPEPSALVLIALAPAALLARRIGSRPNQ